MEESTLVVLAIVALVLFILWRLVFYQPPSLWRHVRPLDTGGLLISDVDFSSMRMVSTVAHGTLHLPQEFLVRRLAENRWETVPTPEQWAKYEQGIRRRLELRTDGYAKWEEEAAADGPKWSPFREDMIPSLEHAYQRYLRTRSPTSRNNTTGLL